MHNDEIAQTFDQLADLLEIDEANPFRVRAYRDAARMLRGLPEDVSAMLERGEDLSELPTIGKDLAGKIAEIVDTGHLQVLEDLKRTVPAGLAELTRIPGLGPKRVKLLYDRIGIKTPQALRAAAERGKLQRLKGFGPKSEENVLKFFKADRVLDKRTRLFDAQKIADRIVAHLAAFANQADITVAGSFRRCAETVGDLDIVVASAAPEKIMDHFATFDEIESIVRQGQDSRHRAAAFRNAGRPESGPARVLWRGRRIFHGLQGAQHRIAQARRWARSEDQ
jgi:DNA polymerase (family 10)